MLFTACNNEETPHSTETQGYNMLLIGHSFFRPYAENLDNLATETNLYEHNSTNQ